MPAFSLLKQDSGKYHPQEDSVLRDQRVHNLGTRWSKVDEMDRVEKTSIKLVQSQAFPKEIEILKMIWREDYKDDRQFARIKRSEVKKSSILYRLDPFLDQDGIIRVGGRPDISQ